MEITFSHTHPQNQMLNKNIIHCHLSKAVNILFICENKNVMFFIMQFLSEINWSLSSLIITFSDIKKKIFSKILICLYEV